MDYSFNRLECLIETLMGDIKPPIMDNRFESQDETLLKAHLDHSDCQDSDASVKVNDFSIGSACTLAERSIGI